MSKTTQFIVSNALASLGISISISFFMTLYTMGMGGHFFSAWLQSFVMGYIIAVPSSMVFVPMVNRLMIKLVKEQI